MRRALVYSEVALTYVSVWQFHVLSVVAPPTVYCMSRTTSASIVPICLNLHGTALFPWSQLHARKSTEGSIDFEMSMVGRAHGLRYNHGGGAPA